MLARREPTTIERSASLTAAIRAMQAGATRSVLITERDGRLVGILTERDVVGRVLAADPPATRPAPVERYMSPLQDALTLDAELGEALELVAKGGYQGLPLVDDAGSVAGISTAGPARVRRRGVSRRKSLTYRLDRIS